jgi:hypothetical protein
MNDIEIVWIDETNIIIKCIYGEFTPPNRLKKHLDTLVDSEFFSTLKAKYNVMCVGCIRKDIDSHTTNNYISMNTDGSLDIASSNDVNVELKGDRKIFSIETDINSKEMVEKFRNAMKTLD